MAIDNKTTHTQIFFNGSRAVPLYPGINILSEDDEQYLLEDDRVQLFMDEGMFTTTSVKKKVYTDDETGLSYIDDTGTKKPVSTQDAKIAPKTENNVSIRTVEPRKFKTSDLKKLGVSAENATKIISAMPSEGYSTVEQLPDIGSDFDKISSVFEVTE